MGASGDDDRYTTSYSYSYNPWNLLATVVEPATDAHPSPCRPRDGRDPPRVDRDRTWTTIYDAGGLPIHEDQPAGVEIDRTSTRWVG